MVGDLEACLQVSVQDMSEQFKSVRSQLEEDQMVSSMMAGLRGSNMNDDNFAADDVQMQLVEVHDESEDAGSLPLTYDPNLINLYWGSRPVAVVTRVLQLMGEPLIH